LPTTARQSQLHLRDLGDGLILRKGRVKDAQALADFNARIHSDDGPDQPDPRLAAWTHDLLTLPHPTLTPGDFTIVEDAKTGQIVSSLNLIPQTWSFAGVPFAVGRPELVGTLPEYRKRGLVRAQFEVVHQWCTERGYLVQAITGIPYYYRLFGYEMVLNLGGGRVGYQANHPKLKEDQSEPYIVRPAQPADQPFMAELYQHGCQRSLVSCLHDEALWQYELTGKSAENVNRLELRMIESTDGEAVGFLAHSPFNWGFGLSAQLYELKAGVSWAEVTPSVIRYLLATGQKNAAQDEKQPEVSSFGLWFGEEHPAYQAMAGLLPRQRKPYAWYLRLPDPAGFLRLVAPILEQRLTGSVLAGHSGELKLSFYTSGLLLRFERGRLVSVEDWQPEPYPHSGDALFPGLTFLQLLFGYRSLEELDYAFADCYSNSDSAQVLLGSLFPKQTSNVWPVA
jgi:GNAT superfamily N-acetyltransferase